MTSASTARLQYFPAAFFAMIMGLLGLVLALQKASHVVPTLAPAAPVVLALAALLFVVIAFFYGLKAVRYPHAVREDFAHPVRLHFVPTFSISLVLFAIALSQTAPDVAHPLLLVGAALHLLLTLVVLNEWINKEHFQVPHLNPAWFIPIVGNLLVPIAGMNFGYVNLSWFYFSIGIVFWIVLFTIIINRVLFHAPLPARLAPTLFIMIAPPAVGFLAYLKLQGTLDSFGRVLFGFAAFLTLFLATQAARLARMRFFLSWWAYSFPLAAMTVASFAMSEISAQQGFAWGGLGLLAVLAVLVAGLLVRTALAVIRREICQPE
jgi:tellurite resistance protein